VELRALRKNLTQLREGNQRAGCAASWLLA
jgi:hypothetical protein